MNSAEKRLRRLFARIFDGAAIESRPPDPSGATPISASGPFGSLTFRAIWADNGWPADIRSALTEVPAGGWPRDLVIAARSISPGALALLEARNANWADETGAAKIVAPGILIVRQGTTDAEQTHRGLSWSPAAVAAGEALLARDWPEGVGTTELANLIQWSPSKVSQVLQTFDAQGWTIKYGPQRGPRARREVIDLEGLLGAWAESVVAQEREHRLAHRVLRSSLDFLEGELAEALNNHVRWALSGWAAANEVAPLVDTVPTLQIYVHDDDFDRPLDSVIRETGLSDVAEGGRIAFYPAHQSVLALAEQSAVGPIASAPRIYADLLALGGRGADAAMHLKEERLSRVRSPRGRRKAPRGLLAWERECRQRLDDLTADQTELSKPYAQGTWSASYRLVGVADEPDLRKFMAILREVAGHETGWPAWWAPEEGASRPRPVGGMIECWFSDLFLRDPANADFWRADPQGRLCLIRSYQEDYERLTPSPQTGFDLVLPIWRTGECLLHAERLAHRLDATAIQFMMRWTGVRGRKLSTVAGRRRMMEPTRAAVDDDIRGFAETTPGEIAADLPGVVRQLVDPLYASFDFFEPPAKIYDEELAAMRSGDFR